MRDPVELFLGFLMGCIVYVYFPYYLLRVVWAWWKGRGGRGTPAG